MGRKVRSYTQEYKNTIVDLFNSGKTYAEISSEYGVPKTTIRQWVNKANNTHDNTTTANENDDEIKAIKKRMAKLEQENEIFKKALSIFQSNKIEEIYKFIDEFKGYYCEKINKNFEVKTMCKVLGISRAAYYKHIHRKPSKYENENKLLDKAILEEYTASKRCYGAPKIQKVLQNRGIKASVKRIQRRMEKLNIRSIVVKKWKPSCPSKNKIEQKENLINGDFSAETINKKWLTDITYIYTVKDGWCYLASVFDCCSDKIVGWHMSKNIDAELAVQAVKNEQIH